MVPASVISSSPPPVQRLTELWMDGDQRLAFVYTKSSFSRPDDLFEERYSEDGQFTPSSRPHEKQLRNWKEDAPVPVTSHPLHMEENVPVFPTRENVLVPLHVGDYVAGLASSNDSYLQNLGIQSRVEKGSSFSLFRNHVISPQGNRHCVDDRYSNHVAVSHLSSPPLKNIGSSVSSFSMNKTGLGHSYVSVGAIHSFPDVKTDNVDRHKSALCAQTSGCTRLPLTTALAAAQSFGGDWACSKHDNVGRSSTSLGFLSPHLWHERMLADDMKQNLCISTFQRAMPSGGKRKVNNFEEPEHQSEESNYQVKRSRAAESHSRSERRRRERINGKLEALRELIPNSSKTDKASLLEDAINYLESLQAQMMVMSFRAGIHIPPTLIPHGRLESNVPWDTRMEFEAGAYIDGKAKDEFPP